MEAETMTGNYEFPELFTTPWFMLTVLSLYFAIVTSWGPKFMKDRQPYELKSFIIVHNIIQVLSCIYVVYEILQVTENSVIQFWKCDHLEETPERVLRLNKMSYFLFCLKFSELIETVIFVLRKKQNQVSKLHIFHHIATVTLVYILINHNSNNFAPLYPIFLNSNVHILMYTYYLIAAVADKRTVRALTPVKKIITVIQMVQFLFILMQVAVVSTKCGVPAPVFTYFSVCICVMLYGFYDFYKNSYRKRASAKK